MKKVILYLSEEFDNALSITAIGVNGAETTIIARAIDLSQGNTIIIDSEGKIKQT